MQVWWSLVTSKIVKDDNIHTSTSIEKSGFINYKFQINSKSIPSVSVDSQWTLKPNPRVRRLQTHT